MTATLVTIPLAQLRESPANPSWAARFWRFVDQSGGPDAKKIVDQVAPPPKPEPAKPAAKAAKKARAR